MNEELWLGNQSNYDLISGWLLARTTSTEKPPAAPALYQTIGHVAVVSIEGSLMTGYVPAWAMSMFGVMGYDNIREAIAAAANDTSIQGILLHVNSTGGQAMGVEDTSMFIRSVRAVKPVVTYNGGNMCSAACWLGTAGQAIFGTASSINGSVGVKMVIMDKSKALADAGYKATIIRYGDNKALGDPMEATTDKAVKHYTAMAETLGLIFEQAVAENLGMTLPVLQAASNGASEFLGAEALAKGFLTHLGNFESALAYVRSLAPTTGARQGSASNRGNQMKTVLELPATIQLSAEQQALLDVAAQTAVSAATAELTGKLELATAEHATLAAELATAKTLVTATETELTNARASLGQVEAKMVATVSALEAANTTATALVTIVADSIKSMATALNTQAVTEGTPTDLLAEHGRISAAYQSKFKMGGNAATLPAGQKETTAPVAKTNAQNLYHLAAARAATSF